jgi:hypothetical protein
MVYGFDGAQKCHDIQSEYVECGDPTGCGVGPANYAWDYQVLVVNVLCACIKLMCEPINAARLD